MPAKKIDLVEDKLLLLSSKAEGALTEARNEERQLKGALDRVQKRIAKIEGQLEKIIEKAESGIDALTAGPKKRATKPPVAAPRESWGPGGRPRTQSAPPAAPPASRTSLSQPPAPGAGNAGPSA